MCRVWRCVREIMMLALTEGTHSDLEQQLPTTSNRGVACKRMGPFAGLKFGCALTSRLCLCSKCDCTVTVVSRTFLNWSLHSFEQQPVHHGALLSLRSCFTEGKTHQLLLKKGARQRTSLHDIASVTVHEGRAWPGYSRLSLSRVSQASCKSSMRLTSNFQNSAGMPSATGEAMELRRLPKNLQFWTGRACSCEFG